MSEKKDAIALLCEKHKVKRLYVFGSITGKDFRVDSDVDLLVRFNDVERELYFKNYLSLKNSLENIFQRPVDLLEEQAIKNPILKFAIERTREKIYG